MLTALGEPSALILWTLQGYLGGPGGEPSDRLAAQLVVGHEQYHRVAHAEPHSRRAFAEAL